MFVYFFEQFWSREPRGSPHFRSADSENYQFCDRAPATLEIDLDMRFQKFFVFSKLQDCPRVCLFFQPFLVMGSSWFTSFSIDKFLKIEKISRIGMLKGGNPYDPFKGVLAILDKKVFFFLKKTFFLFETSLGLLVRF